MDTTSYAFAWNPRRVGVNQLHWYTYLGQPQKVSIFGPQKVVIFGPIFGPFFGYHFGPHFGPPFLGHF